MSLEKIYFGLLWQLKAGEENFLNSYIVLLRAGLTCTIKSSPIGWPAGAVWLVAQKDNVGSQKWYFPSRIVLTKCVENFSKCNLKIFYGIKIEKMEAKVLFEVEAVGRDLGMVRGLHFFNRDTIENFQITRGKFFQTLSQTISGGECFFAQLGYILS